MVCFVNIIIFGEEIFCLYFSYKEWVRLNLFFLLLFIVFNGIFDSFKVIFDSIFDLGYSVFVGVFY